MTQDPGVARLRSVPDLRVPVLGPSQGLEQGGVGGVSCGERREGTVTVDVSTTTEDWVGVVLWP